jgi:hypothetical protein
MKKFLVALFLVNSISHIQAQQCPTDLLSGQNLIVNGDFSEDYTGWSFTPDSDGDLNTGPDGYQIFTGSPRSYSVPGNIFVGTGAQMPYFNNAFTATFHDHSPSSDDKFLMIDGVCVPGIKLWTQSNIPVSPNTNYYFSVWINSLKDNPNYPGIVNFDVNGINIGANIVAPTLGGANPSSTGWQKYETVWNSGTNPPATVTISIEGNQTVGCAGSSGESDFAIDDIAFIPGCSYGSAGPQPDLGPDRTLCGLGGSGILLNAGVPQNSTTTITWSDGTTGFGMSAPYTLNVTAPGTYSVCVSDNGSCTKSDVVVISNTFSVDIGPDLQLCDPASVTLSAGFTGVGVTYKWYKNFPTEADGNNTQETYFVNTPGTYKVEVTDPSCGTQTAQATITTKAPVATNAVYCDPGSLTLKVSPYNSGKYKWWTSATSTDPADMVLKGDSAYTFTATPPTDYTFYVQDTSSFRIPVGLPLTGNGLTNPQQRSVQSETELTFNVSTAISIDSVYVDMKVYNCPAQSIQLQVLDASRNVVATSASWTPTAADGCVTGLPSVIFKMPVGISLPVGNGYILKFVNSSNMNWYQTGMTYPQSYSGVITFTGNSTSSYAANAIPGMYRWIVTAGTACARVPVTATYKTCTPPPPPPTPNAGSDFAVCNTNTAQLNATLNNGEAGVWTFAAGSSGTVNPASSPTASVTFAGDTVQMVWNVTNAGGTSRDTVMVTKTTVATPSIVAVSSTCANTAGLTFTASPDNTSTGSTYTWTLLSGDMVLVSGATTYQLTADAHQTKSIVTLTETNNNCSASVNDTLKILPPTDQAIAGSDFSTCNTSVTLTGNIPVVGTGSWSAVTSDPNQVLTQSPPASATVSNLSLNTVYEYMYTITGTCGTTSDNVLVTVGAGGFAVASIIQPSDTLCVGSERSLTVTVNGGSGSFTYSWLKKGTFNSVTSTVPTYTFVTSDVSEEYYLYVKDNVTNCTAAVDSVNIASVGYQKLYVPNLITPNGDNSNDEFKIVEANNHNKQMLAKNSTLKIYNSWGNEIYTANNYNNDWKAPHTSDGVYYYYLKAGCGGEEHKSWVQILGNVNK